MHMCIYRTTLRTQNQRPTGCSGACTHTYTSSKHRLSVFLAQLPATTLPDAFTVI